MGKLRSFQLSLTDGCNGVYHPGQCITGQVFLDLKTPMKMRSITLNFDGTAHVHWTEDRGPNQNSKEYYDNETYFNRTVDVWGSAVNDGLFDNSPEHPAGQHVYPFQFKLPRSLPSSFEGAHGWVRYWIRGNIDKPWKFDQNTKIAFTVLSVYDLNQNSLSRNPSQNEGSKTLCHLCCASGSITCKLKIDRTGYVPGEFIVVNGEVDNKSNMTLTSKLRLKMLATFHAPTKSRSTYKDLITLRKGEVEPGDREIWMAERIHIPPLPPSGLFHCNIIDIKYMVVMIADPNGPAFGLEVPVGVLIGTVPLQNVIGMYSNRPYEPPPVSLPLEPLSGPDLYPHAPELNASQPSSLSPPPPTYKSLFGKVNVCEEDESEYTRGQTDYAPVYIDNTYI